jgi:N-formylglutamate deformylase
LSCPWEWLLKGVEILEDLWRPHPVEIAFNDPYFGGYITQHYSDPKWSGHKPGMQIEVNRKLYLDWETQEPLPNRVKQLNQVFEELVRRFQKLLLRA